MPSRPMLYLKAASGPPGDNDMKTDDYLSRRAYKPGEFERLQAAFDAQVRWLAAQLDGPMSCCHRSQDVAQALADFERWFPGEPLPDEQAVRTVLAEVAYESCGLLAQQALSCWYWHERESPELSSEELARMASEQALRQEGWDTEPSVREALVEALRRGIPPELR